MSTKVVRFLKRGLGPRQTGTWTTAVDNGPEGNYRVYLGDYLPWIRDRPSPRPSYTRHICLPLRRLLTLGPARQSVYLPVCHRSVWGSVGVLVESSEVGIVRRNPLSPFTPVRESGDPQVQNHLHSCETPSFLNFCLGSWDPFLDPGSTHTPWVVFLTSLRLFDLIQKRGFLKLIEIISQNLNFDSTTDSCLLHA